MLASFFFPSSFSGLRNPPLPSVFIYSRSALLFALAEGEKKLIELGFFFYLAKKKASEAQVERARAKESAIKQNKCFQEKQKK